MSRARDNSRVVSSTILTLDGSNNVGLGSTEPTAKFNVTGIVSATSFFGDGSNLEGVASAGLGTALGESNPLDVVYYTDNVLNITADTTITVPTGSDVAYTQYAEVVVDDTRNLTIADGDDFVPDILGLSTAGVTPLTGAGGRIRADLFTNKVGTGAPTFQAGLQVTGVCSATDFSGPSGAAADFPNGLTATTGNFSGVLTYEDVNNVDSLGIITARQGVNSLGIVTATAFAGHDYLSAPFGPTVTFDVTRAAKDATHRYQGQGSGQGYYIGGVAAPFLTLSPGRTYKFNQADSTNTTHPIVFYLEADKTTEYSTGVTYYADGVQSTSAAYNSAFDAATDRYTQIVVSDDTPVILHYMCYNHGYMGNAVNTNSNSANKRLIANTQSGTYTLVATDSGKYIWAAGTVTIPNNIFSRGDMVTIVNDTNGNLTLTNNLSVMYMSSDGTTAASRTLGAYGMATILFVSGTAAYISGAGLS